MILIEDGRSKNDATRHIRSSSFWLHDRVMNGEIVIIHCVTEEMLADLFTKVIGGARFLKLVGDIAFSKGKFYLIETDFEIEG